MLIAQALGEYASASAVATAFSTSVSTVRGFLFDIKMETWVMVAIGVFLALFVRSRLK
jgi:hypothetical protein